MICEGQVIACIEEPAVVARILRHLGPRAAQAPPSTADDKPTDPLLRFVQRAQWDRLKRLGHSLVRNNRDDDTFLHTACTLGVVRAVLLIVAGGVLAPIVAAFYDEPLLLWLLPLCALRIFFQATESSQFTASSTAS
jgi:hypothetical protein